MLKNREYLHLEEIDQIDGINKYDLIDLFQRQKIMLYAWCSEPHLIAQVKFKDFERSSTAGLFSYSGIVEINRQKVDALLNGTKKVFQDKFLIKELDQVEKWTQKQPPKITYPNKHFINHTHLPQPPSFPFYAFIDAEDSLKKNALLLKVMNSMNDYAQKDSEHYTPADHIELLEKLYADNISLTSKAFKLSDLRFSKKEIMELIKPTENKTLVTEQKQISKALSPLDEIILDILEKEERLRSDQIWNILRLEAKKDASERNYDQYGVIEEVSSTTLIWIDRNEKMRNLSRESFKNKVYKLKKT